MRVAVVHDWMVSYTGAERVLNSILELFPNADLFVLFDFLKGRERDFLKNHNIFCSFLQRLPSVEKYYRYLLFLMPIAIEKFDFNGYDLVISSSAAISKGIITGPNTLHIAYIHTPPRYVWDLRYSYLKRNDPLISIISSPLLHYIRIWDQCAGQRPDFIIANSKFVQKRIRKYYKRDSIVIYPPVDINEFVVNKDKLDYYVTVSRLVPYKRVDILIDAFNENGKSLVVIGDGPEFMRLKKKAKKNISLLGYQPRKIVIDLIQKAKGFVFAGEEDFGIALVEAMAAGTPIIAYDGGGAREIIHDGKNGLLYSHQTTLSLQKKIIEFERFSFDSMMIRRCSEKFSKDFFINSLRNFINSCTNR